MGAPSSAEQLARDLITGHDDPDNPQPHTCWFPRWWIGNAGSSSDVVDGADITTEFKTGYVTWSCDGQHVRLHVHDSGLRRVWKLTDRYDDHGCRLGIYPD